MVTETAKTGCGETAAVTLPRRPSNLKKRIKGSITGWLFILPTVFGICVFTLYPIIQSLYYSFFDYNMTSRFDFVGFGNYIRIFSGDSDMPKVVTNTLLFALLNIPVTLCGSYLLALFLNVNLKGIKVFRVLYYLPCTMPAIVSGIVWSYIMRYNVETPGLFNQMFSAMGLPMSRFFYADNFTAVASIVLMNLWSLGGGTIIWLAQFKNIPKQLYEAAEIDGAGRFAKMFYITIPFLIPTFFVLFVLQIGNLLNNGMDQYYVFENAMNKESIEVLDLYVYNTGLKNNNIPYATAIGMLKSVISVILVFSANFASKKVRGTAIF